MATFRRFFLLALAVDSTLALAQVAPGAGIPNMQEIAHDLGVQCNYCHAGQRLGQPPAAAPAPDGQPPSKFEIARAMIAMTNGLNGKIVAATGKSPAAATKVTCITCHRGVAVPGELSDIVARTTLRESSDAAVAKYRDLRAHYYGRDAYDFGEETLLSAAEKVVRVKPQASIPLLRLNLEFYPRSVRSYTGIAFAYTRTLDDESAITTLEKALEIEPNNGMVRGQLEQLKSYHRNRHLQ